MKIVVDTNCLRASVPPFSKYYQLYREFAAKNFIGMLAMKFCWNTKKFSQKHTQFRPRKGYFII